ncbi:MULTISPECIES: hypothetical protein [Pontibacillus]|uniref:Uncharacterized protein n=1 Tax=Pontibacillus chungwhensis TaxID=265426 RepID=A0ABY8UW00_9BACI|nr:MULTISPECIES: hypothetical protein [Pontibacillus]MCD5323161.1 hypothetical protein [Pontibacillus sp. HN14]WIF96549.1 hypothetical protein QNI29_12385 [Pontibacillus chungwhensis]
MAQEGTRLPFRDVVLYFISLGILIWVLNSLTLMNALWFGVPILVISSIITYIRSNKVQSNVHRYLQEKGVTKGIVFPIIMILQVSCFLVSISLESGPFIVNGQTGFDDYMVREFNRRLALSLILFLFGIRTVIAGWLEKSKSSIWIGVSVIFLYFGIVYKMGISYGVW